MQPLCYFACTFLCSLSFLCPVLSIDCADTEYTWPVDQPRLCCNKCPPGKRMFRRSKDSCDNECRPCTATGYTDTYNVKMNCEICENCDKPNMEYESTCSAIHNAVCRCHAGYRCKDLPCKQCVPIPSTTTAPTLPPPATALTTIWQPSHQIRDTMWFLVIIGLLCAGIALAVVTKIKPFLRWIKSRHGYFVAKETAAVTQSPEDEEVSTPVQEVVGKCDV